VATRFSRSRRGIKIRLEPGELHLLDQLFADVARLLADDTPPSLDPLAAELGLSDLGLSENVAPPEDPAVARLLPDASPDPAAAGEFRRFTERGLRRRKVEGLRTVRNTLAAAEPGRGHWPQQATDEDVRVRLDDDAAHAWVVALTDLRLVLAERLGVRTEADAEAVHERADDADADDPAAWLAMVYDFVSWLQESLAEVLLADLPPGGEGRRVAPPPSV